MNKFVYLSLGKMIPGGVIQRQCIRVTFDLISSRCFFHRVSYNFEVSNRVNLKKRKIIIRKYLLVLIICLKTYRLELFRRDSLLKAHSEEKTAKITYVLQNLRFPCVLNVTGSVAEK